MRDHSKWFYMISNRHQTAEPHATGVWKACLSFWLVLALSISGLSSAHSASSATQHIDFSSQLHQVTFALTQESLRVENRGLSQLTATDDNQPDTDNLLFRAGFSQDELADISQLFAARIPTFTWQFAPYQLSVARAPPSLSV